MTLYRPSVMLLQNAAAFGASGMMALMPTMAIGWG